jgi:hypothetical protein
MFDGRVLAQVLRSFKAGDNKTTELGVWQYVQIRNTYFTKSCMNGEIPGSDDGENEWQRHGIMIFIK